MIHSSTSRALHEPEPPSHDETSTGLEDPRKIHPSPDEVISDSFPVPDSSSETTPSRNDVDHDSKDIDRGIVDPRTKSLEPDM